MINKSTIVFCDFDGTITSKDSFGEFIKFYHSTWRYYFGLLLHMPILVLYKLGLYNNQKAKEKLICYFFKDENEIQFNYKSKKFALTKIHEFLLSDAMPKLNWYKSEGCEVVIVSASFINYLKPWCDKNGFDVIATQLEIINDKVSGKIKGKNCYGEEKVNRIKQNYNINEYYIIAYGDTKGDMPMLSLANETYYKKFKK